MTLARIFVVLFILVGCSQPGSRSDERFFNSLELPTGETVVVAEGELEARSIGSFSLRIYAHGDADNKTTFFVTGLVYKRNGFLESIYLDDIDNDNLQDIVVVTHSAGSGNFQSAYAFKYSKSKLELISSVEGIDANKDTSNALKSAIK